MFAIPVVISISISISITIVIPVKPVLVKAGDIEPDLLAFIECKCYIRVMPRKIRDLIRDLRKAGFIDRGGVGNH
jgi:hypothetical protein